MPPSNFLFSAFSCDLQRHFFISSNEVKRAELEQNYQPNIKHEQKLYRLLVKEQCQVNHLVKFGLIGCQIPL